MAHTPNQNIVDESSLSSRNHDYTFNGERRRFKVYDYTKSVGQTIRVAPKHGSWTFVAGATQEESLKNRREAELASIRQKFRSCGVKRTAADAGFGLEKHDEDIADIINTRVDLIFKKMMKKESQAADLLSLQLDGFEEDFSAPFEKMKVS